MSIFTKQAQVAAFPAYVVFRREADSTGFVNITVADELGLHRAHRNGGYYQTFTPGSVVSYALEYNECPIAAVADCRAKMVSQPHAGHKLHWINANGSCITAHKQAQRTLIEVTVGMRVRFEGQLFTIEATHNNNLHFVPVK